jgi:hypothetical protein
MPASRIKMAADSDYSVAVALCGVELLGFRAVADRGNLPALEIFGLHAKFAGTRRYLPVERVA